MILPTVWNLTVFFSNSDNSAYTEMKHLELYTDIRPPECRTGGSKAYGFKGDVYVLTFTQFFLFINIFF